MFVSQGIDLILTRRLSAC